MKENAFIDSDVILDLLQERKPFFEDSQNLFSLIELQRSDVSALNTMPSNRFTR